jgi:hypothetical protein
MPHRLAAKMRTWQLRKKSALEGELSELLAMRKGKPHDQTSNSEEIDEQSERRSQAKEQEIAQQTRELSTQDPLAGLNVRVGLVRERLRRYPADVREVGPTRFSNALRAIETYGWNRYRIDSQTLWSELQTVVPEELRGEHERARAPINFFVSLIYLSFIQLLVCVALLLRQSGPTLSLIIVGAALVLLIPAWYRLAVLNTRYLMAVMQATVNVGRLELAAKFGLTIPLKLEEERDMWERVFWFVHEPFDPKYAEDLDAYRIVPDADE